MKKKYLLMFSLLFIVVISIGFAALSRNLNISGLTSVKENKWDIYFAGIEQTRTSRLTVTRNQVNYNVFLNKPGDKNEFYFNVINDGTIDAMISLIESNNLSDELKNIINYSITYLDGEEIQEKNLLRKNSFETFKVVVEYEKDIQKEELLNENINLNLAIDLEYQQADNEALPRSGNRNYIVEDLSGNNNRALVYGATKNDDGTFSIKKSSDFIDLGLNSYSFNDSATLAIRIKFDKEHYSNEFFGNWDAAGTGIYIHNNKLYFDIYNKSTSQYEEFESNFTPQISSWYTMVGTYDGTALRFYINGEAIPDINGNLKYPVSGNIRETFLPFLIGANPVEGSLNAATSNDITVSSALIFDRALTAEEISSDYRDIINPTNKDDLLVFYEFN